MTLITGKAPRQNTCKRCGGKGHQPKTCPNVALPGWVRPQAKSTSAQGPPKNLPKSGNSGKKRKTPSPELVVDSDGNAGVDGDESDAEEQDVRLDPRVRADRDAEESDLDMVESGWVIDSRKPLLGSQMTAYISTKCQNILNIVQLTCNKK